MSDLLTLLAIVAVWIILQTVILPRIGEPT